MNKYLIEIAKFFGGTKEFIIEAENKQEALEKAKAYVEKSYEFDNCKTSTIRVVKKLQK